MARRARASRSRNEQASAAVPSPYIRRTLPFFDVLDEDQLEKLDAQVDWLLENVGLAFRDGPLAGSVLTDRG